MEFVRVPAGDFMMGSSPEEVAACVDYWESKLVDTAFNRTQFESWIRKECPQHPVSLPEFRIARYPVTNEEYDRFRHARNWTTPESIRSREPGTHPVWGVNYNDCSAFCAWLSEESGEHCRLPTEEEWEYAARGPSRREYPFGDRFDATCCNTIEAGIGSVTPVDHYSSGVSEFGLWDMAGNVEEWTSSWYQPYPGGELILDDLLLKWGRYRVLRGGSFARGGDLARCARRHGPLDAPVYRFRGFRVVIDDN
jgi:formylglycine-generating enzyme required for sulfatase activity